MLSAKMIPIYHPTRSGGGGVGGGSGSGSSSSMKGWVNQGSA